MDMIEPRFADGKNIGDMTQDEVKGYAQKLRDAGLGVSAVGSPLGKVKLDSDLDAHMEQVKKICEFANILDTKNIRMFSFYSPEGKSIRDCKNEVIDGLGRMLDIADTFGVTLCHENEGGIYGERPHQCMELLEAFGGRLKCVYDMGIYVLQQVNAWEGYQLQRSYIQYFHIKDAMAKGAIVPPGKGEGQIQRILFDFAQDHDQVLFTLEPHLQTFDGLNALVTSKSFTNPYQFPDCETAFTEAVKCMKELISQ
jgi:sugar phosphate isomerase/epimerase